jgi:hypothetical protein
VLVSASRRNELSSALWQERMLFPGHVLRKVR